MLFNLFWQLLRDHGSSNYYKHDCSLLWESLTPEQQQQLYDNIATRLQNGLFVNYNPLEAIHDNMPRACTPHQEPAPTNYNRSNLTPPEPIMPACYKGEWGMYTLSDIRTFGLQTKGGA
ncbi:MAG: hypothetical protein J5688_05525 [Paludibacteraceae bacterium]|nr:hypothetical protein [Paludibacteraceae bacterium]